MKLERALQLVFPAHCLCCAAQVSAAGALCPSCRGKMPFIAGLVCDCCGAPLPGESAAPDERLLCDDCLTMPRPWQSGRSALLYSGPARRIVLGLKNFDRTDIARPAAGWMLEAARPILRDGMIVVPIPSLWTRLVKRRYNPAALLGRQFAARASLQFAPRALIRPGKGGSQGGRNREERIASLEGAFRPHPRHGAILEKADVLLIDDVMTTGATLAAAASACLEAGARSVGTVTLARVAKQL